MFSVSKALLNNCAGKRYSSLFVAESLLSDENMEKTVARFQAMKPIRLQPHEPARKAAVLIPLCVVDSKVSLLYTLRAPNLKTHRGQVSFPGGMQDTKDRNLLATALRETKEELGIEEDDFQIWGSGNLIVTRSDMCILPVIGRLKYKLKEVKKLNINTGEVDEVFTVPLENLCNPSHLGHTQFRGAYTTPVFLGGPKRVWGLTAMITHVFLKSLLPTTAYNHKIKMIPAVKMGTTRYVAQYY